MSSLISPPPCEALSLISSLPSSFTFPPLPPYCSYPATEIWAVPTPPDHPSPSSPLTLPPLRSSNCRVLYSSQPSPPWYPLADIFFCDSCSALRCPLDVSTEFEAFFCPTCLKLFPTAEAAVLHHRCPRCLTCPACSTDVAVLQLPPASTTYSSPSPLLLSDSDCVLRGGIASPPSDTLSSAGLYVFSCSHCHWHSYHTGLAASSTADLFALLSCVEEQLVADYRSNNSKPTTGDDNNNNISDTTAKPNSTNLKSPAEVFSLLLRSLQQRSPPSTSDSRTPAIPSPRGPSCSSRTNNNNGSSESSCVFDFYIKHRALLQDDKEDADFAKLLRETVGSAPGAAELAVPWGPTELDAARHLQEVISRRSCVWEKCLYAADNNDIPLPFVTLTDVLNYPTDQPHNNNGTDYNACNNKATPPQTTLKSLPSLSIHPTDISPIALSSLAPASKRVSLWQRCEQPLTTTLLYSSTLLRPLAYTSPPVTSLLLPVRRRLSARRSHRCRECNKYVIKSQMNPSASPYFRLNHSAAFFVPHFFPRPFALVSLPSDPSQSLEDTTLGDSTWTHEELKTPTSPVVAAGSILWVELLCVNFLASPLVLTLRFDGAMQSEPGDVEVLAASFVTGVGPYDEMEDDAIADKSAPTPETTTAEVVVLDSEEEEEGTSEKTVLLEGTPGCRGYNPVTYRSGNKLLLRLPVRGTDGNDQLRFGVLVRFQDGSRRTHRLQAYCLVDLTDVKFVQER
eukprot:GHVS01011680.1.p1 GENE.GHVS01011680.1~~GHVS01011680.1.p1  ORF type:complete len:737 (-),score=127.26 GHVS01011680.1:58-2268(-)